ncbi:hypothetical protein H6F51_21435 [Cyanobacteria bacterium FACHB-DQ100]|nr:hypothetical protein [Cyanobacteria bacterium FACHB-DQ100]
MNEELNKRIQGFLDAFEGVFDVDWDYTKNLILDEDFIDPSGTFINPFPGEHFTGGKGDNWGNRSSLLSAYRELKAFATSEGIYDPDAAPWNQ